VVPPGEWGLHGGGCYTRCDQTVRADYLIQVRWGESVCLEVNVSRGLALMKCLDCGAIRHRIVPEDHTMACTGCGSANVLYPYNPTY
jgi:DNA-directed RNA polymerase subunit RPC12/RpoP